VKPAVLGQYRDFMGALGCSQSPLAAYYSNEKPGSHRGPHGGFFVQIEKAADIVSLAGKAGRLMGEKREKFRCLFPYIAGTRKDSIPSVFDRENFGCPGCRFYLGFIEKLPRFNLFFTSNGFPPLHRGERYFPSRASAGRHAASLEGIRAKGKYVIFEPMDKMSFDVDPDLVIFFSNIETISGLAALVSFVTDDADAVQSPFTSGCGSIFSWPYKYAQAGVERAVLGVFDPAARPHMTPGDMTLSIPYRLFVKMLAGFKKSFLYADRVRSGLIKETVPGWPDVRKRAERAGRAIHPE
jgi:uncharacterized protein (DUF169 family)